ncbi:MAG: histidine phosphatase family protein [Saprospiraceae bacterium]|nr:histidine phosphatase family protein [Saprospiraceae bacterium]
MKKLYLVRHAKSSWDDYMLSDEKRPLSERGKRDAPAMAKMLSEKDPDLEYLVSSPAKRALETAKIFRKAFNLSRKRLDEDSRLYHASPSIITEVIQNVDDQYRSVAIFGHNPGMTDFLNRFSDASIDNIPTCGVAIIDVGIDSWKEFSSERGKLLAFYYPKMFGLF